MFCVVLIVAVTLVSVLCPRLGFQQTLINYKARPRPFSSESTSGAEKNLATFMLTARDDSAGDNQQSLRTKATGPSIRPTYVLTLEFSGQQGSAALCLSALQCFLSSIYDHFYVVEPHLVESRLLSYTVSGKPSWMTFGSLFNLNTFNRESRKAGYAEMVGLKEFQKSITEYKYIVYVITGSVRKVVWSANASGDCFDDKDFPNIEENYQTHMIKARKGFEGVRSGKCLVRIIELLTSRGEIPSSTVSSVLKFIFDVWSPSDVLLVFSSWPKCFLPVYQPLNGVNCLKEYKASRSFTKSQFQPSSRLVQDAENYERKFLGRQNRLAIMLRVERVVTKYLKEKRGAQSNAPKTIEDCFQKVLALKSEIGRKYNVSIPLVTLDIGGRYGTKSFKNKTSIEALSIKTLEDLYGKRWNMEQWENGFVEAAGGETHPGYIAALQGLLASRADCLVLVGGGNFQALAVNDYLKYHKSVSTCVHFICCMSHYNEVQRTFHNTL